MSSQHGSTGITFHCPPTSFTACFSVTCPASATFLGLLKGLPNTTTRQAWVARSVPT